MGDGRPFSTRWRKTPTFMNRGEYVSSPLVSVSASERSHLKGARQDHLPLPVAASCLRRWRLCWRQAQGRAAPDRRMDRRDRQTLRCRKGVCRPPAPLGCRANPRLAEPQPSPRQGLRADHRLGNRMAVHRLDPALRTPHRKSMKSRRIILNQTLRGDASGIPDLICWAFHIGTREHLRLRIYVLRCELEPHFRLHR